MSLSGPTEENKPGQYGVDGIAATKPDGSEFVKLGDGFNPRDGGFLDLAPDDSLIVASFDTDAGDPVMIEVVGSDKIDRISAESLDRLLGNTLTL